MKRAAILYENGHEPRKLDIDEKDAYQIELEYFVGHIESGKPFDVITPEDSRHVVEVICAIQESLGNGQGCRIVMAKEYIIRLDGGG